MFDAMVPGLQPCYFHQALTTQLEAAQLKAHALHANNEAEGIGHPVLVENMPWDLVTGDNTRGVARKAAWMLTTWPAGRYLPCSTGRHDCCYDCLGCTLSLTCAQGHSAFFLCTIACCRMAWRTRKLPRVCTLTLGTAGVPCCVRVQGQDRVAVLTVATGSRPAAAHAASAACTAAGSESAGCAAAWPC